MTSEEQQERAALYALGLLDADEAAAFEYETAANGELRVLAMELRETAASLARTDAEEAAPPPGLKERLLARVAEEPGQQHPAAGKVIAGPSAWFHWVPWTAAAVLTFFAGSLAWFVADEQTRYHQAVQAEQTAIWNARELAAQLRESEAQNARIAATPFRQVVFCALEPVPAAQRTGPRAVVLWDSAHRHGQLRITELPPVDAGKDYQLWAVEAGRKDPVSAGVVKVDAGGSAEIEFQPEADDAKAQVVAFALSVERAGGVPKSEGPIIYLGKL